MNAPPGGGIARLINMPKHGFLLQINTYRSYAVEGEHAKLRA
jgi:hypothetical protein